MILPFLGLVGLGEKGDSTQTPAVVRQLLTALDQIGLTFSLNSALVLYVVLMIAVSLIRFGARVFQHSLMRDFSLQLQSSSFQRTVNMPWSELSARAKGEVFNQQMGDVNRVIAVVNEMLRFLSHAALIGVFVLAACQLSWEITLVSIFGGLLAGAIVSPISKRLLEQGHELRENSKNLFERIGEDFAALKLIKCFGKEEQASKQYCESASNLAWTNYRLFRWRSLTPVIQSAIGGLLVAVLVWISLSVFQLGAAELIVIILILSRLYPRISQIQQNWQSIYGNWPSAKAFSEHYQNPVSISQKPRNLGAPIPLKTTLELHQVSFAYPNREPVFKEFDLEIPAGQITALAGPSGAGKTTLADLVLGLLKPQSGEISVDELALDAETRENWKRSTAYLPQDHFLFSDTLRNNLLWIDPEASDRRLWETLELAAAADFVRQLPDGLDTIVGERGANISGGERQRITLARALLANPTLLVLDEPTSALDLENEDAIRKALIGLKPQLTILLIAHRGSLLEIADRVIELPRSPNH
ncbi:MAG: ABC transporter ATP-binding protein [Verrucomicrobiota bacterium]